MIPLPTRNASEVVTTEIFVVEAFVAKLGTNVAPEINVEIIMQTAPRTVRFVFFALSTCWLEAPIPTEVNPIIRTNGTASNEISVSDLIPKNAVEMIAPAARKTNSQ